MTITYDPVSHVCTVRECTVHSDGRRFYVEHLATCRGVYCDAAYQCDRLGRRTAHMEADRVQGELDRYARKRRAWGRGDYAA